MSCLLIHVVVSCVGWSNGGDGVVAIVWGTLAGFARLQGKGVTYTPMSASEEQESEAGPRRRTPRNNRSQTGRWPTARKTCGRYRKVLIDGRRCDPIFPAQFYRRLGG